MELLSDLHKMWLEMNKMLLFFIGFMLEIFESDQ